MWGPRFIVGAIAVVALLLLAAAARRPQAFIGGTWRAGEAFLEQARLSSFSLYIPAGGGEGFLHVEDDSGAPLVSAPARVAWGRVASALAGLRPLLAAAAGGAGAMPLKGFAFGLGEDEEELLAPLGVPARLEGELDPARGTLLLSAGGKLFAELHRDPFASPPPAAE